MLTILTEYTSDGKHVAVTDTLHGVCRDPKDDMVFECAVKAEAEIIVSGDHDLLSVKLYNGIQVLTAQAIPGPAYPAALIETGTLTLMVK